MSEDKRKNARTQGKYSGGDKEYTSRKPDKQSSKMPSSTDKNKGEKRKSGPSGSRPEKEIDLEYEENDKYTFKQLEPARKPQELRFTEPVRVISSTTNGESRLLYNQNFMKLAEADMCFQILLDSTAWHDKNIVIRGTEYPQPRLVAWYGPYPYTYAGATLEAKEMPSTVIEIKAKVEANLREYGINVELNSVLLNLYRNEKDSVAWHSDDEFSLGVCPTIASVSLGVTRKFEMRPKAHVKEVDANEVLFVNLTPGSLIVMDGCMQKDWQHRVPKGFHDTGARINLTFRTIYPVDQAPPEMPLASNMKSARSPNTKVIQQPDHKFDEENFPPLGMESSDRKSSALPKESVGRDYQQPERESQSEEYWDDEINGSFQNPEETQKVENNLNKETIHDPIIDSPESSPSQIDFNSNVNSSEKRYYIKLSEDFNEFTKNENHSNSSETLQSRNFDTNEAYELECKDANPSEIKPVKIKPESVEFKTKAVYVEKKHKLNAYAPDFVPQKPQNRFDLYNPYELAELCRKKDDFKNEDLPNVMEAVFNYLYTEDTLLVTRDFRELDVYSEMNDGSLSAKHLRIILARIGSMIDNALYYKNAPKFNRNSNRPYNDNYRKPRQSYTQSRRY